MDLSQIKNIETLSYRFILCNGALHALAPNIRDQRLRSQLVIIFEYLT